MTKSTKYLFLLVGLCLAINTAEASPKKHRSRIDRVRTDKDVMKLVASFRSAVPYSDKNYMAEHFTLFNNDGPTLSDLKKRYDSSCTVAIDENDSILAQSRYEEASTFANARHVFDSLHLAHFYKVDIDNNGYTDLLINGGENIYYIRDSGNDHLALDYVSGGLLFDYCFAEPVIKDGNCFINIYQRNLHEGFNGDKRKIKYSLLKYIYSGFCEYNPTPARHSIEKVAYDLSAGFTLANFFSNIDINGSFSYGDYDRYLVGSIDSNAYNNIAHLVNYIDFTACKDTTVSVPAADVGVGTLKIVYDGGKVKTIVDYGLHASFGLQHLYSILHDLPTTQYWQKLKK